MRTSSAARQFVTGAPLAAVLLVLLPGLAAAQEPVRSFDQLNTRLKVGDTIRVTDAQGREMSGKLRAISASAITLGEGPGRESLGPASAKSRRRGAIESGRFALYGLALGFAAGAVVGAVSSSGCESDCISNEWLAVGGIFGGIGAGTGAIIGAFVAGPEMLIYRALGASGSARLSLAPVITPRTKGVAV